MSKPWLASYADGVRHSLNYEQITMSDSLTRTAQKYPNINALIFFKTKINFRQLDEMVNRMANALVSLGVKPGESIVLGSLPIFHAFGLFILNICVRGVWTLVLIPRPETHFIMEAIHKNRVNLFPGVPSMFIGILNHPKIKKYDLSSLDICAAGAAPCLVDIIRRFETISGAQIVEGFGISEKFYARNFNKS